MTTRGANLGSAVLRISTDTSTLNQQLEQVRRDTEKRFGTLVRIVGAAFLAAGAAITGVAGLSAKAASNLEESVNAVNVVFKDAAGTILEFSKTASRSVLLSQASFNQLATETGALLQNFGLSQQQAADQTLLLSQRAADLASVFNTDVSDALGAINAALRGETEPIRRYAADVTDATLQQFALAEGLDVTVAAMSQAEKAQLRLRVLMSQTADVQGDVANTSDSVANQTRRIRAEMADAAATIGTSLLPHLSRLLGHVASIATAVGDWLQANEGLARVLVPLGATLGVVSLGLGGILLLLPQVVAGVTLLRTAMAGLGTVALGPIGLVIAGVAALVAGVVILNRRFGDTERVSAEVREQLSPFHRALLDSKEAGRDLSDTLNDHLNEALSRTKTETNEAKDEVRDLREELALLSLDQLQRQRDAAESARLSRGDIRTAEGLAEFNRLEQEFQRLDDALQTRTAIVTFEQGTNQIEQSTRKLADALKDPQTSAKQLIFLFDQIVAHEENVADANEHLGGTWEATASQGFHLANITDDLGFVIGQTVLKVGPLADAQDNLGTSTGTTTAAIRDQADALNDIGDAIGLQDLSPFERSQLFLGDVQAAQAQRLANLRGQAVNEQQRYNDRLADIQEAHVERIEDLDIALARDEAALTVSQGKERIDLANKQADQLTAIRRDYHADRREIDRRTNAAITDARRDHQRNIEELVETHQERLADLDRGAEDKREEADLRRGRRIEDIEREHAEAVGDLRYDPQRAVKVAALILNRDRNLEELEIGHARTLEDIQRNLGDDQEQAEIDFARRREDSAEAHQAKIVDIQARGQRQQAERRIQFNMATEAAERQRVIELRELAQKHIDNRLALEQQDGERREDATTTFNRNLEDVQDDLESNLLASASEWGDQFSAEFQSTYDRIVAGAQRAAAAARAALSSTAVPSSGGGRSIINTPRATPRYNPFNDATGEPLGFARGGIGLPTPGGIPAFIAEASVPEAIIPLTPPVLAGIGRGIGAAGGGRTLIVNHYGDNYGVDDFNTMVNRAAEQFRLDGGG